MPTLATQFTTIMAGLRAAIANHTDRSRVGEALYVAIWTRVGRITTRFETLFARWQAGTLPKLRPRRTAPSPAHAGALAAKRTERGGGTPQTSNQPTTPTPRLKPQMRPYIPRGRAWLVAVVGYHAAGRASQLQHLLSQPDFIEFLAAVPRAGRILRPLCHTLGIPASAIPALALPARPPRPRKPRPPKPPRPPKLRYEDIYPIGFRRLGNGPMPVRRRHRKSSSA